MISVVVCTFNRARLLEQTLATLARMHTSRLEWELIVVDNNSTDDTKTVVAQSARSSSLPIRYVFERTQGHSTARNTGVASSRGEIVAFTDDDVTVDPHWLEAVDEIFMTGCAGMGGKIVPAWRCERPRWFDEELLTGVTVRFDEGNEAKPLTRSPFGANMAFQRRVFAEYGVFRTDLGRVGTTLSRGEDAEFGWRLLAAGESLMYAPGAVVYHPVEAERATLAYCQRWFYEYGKGVMRAGSVPADAVRYAGVPRYLFRSLAESLCKWMAGRNSVTRLSHRLQTFDLLGQVVEAYRASRRRA